MLCVTSTTPRPCSPEALDEVEHLARLRDAERRGRLVEDDELGVPHDRLGDGHRLPLAAGQAGDRLADGADRRDRQVGERLGRTPLHVDLVEPAEPVELLAPEEHVLDDVQVVREREVLVDDLDTEPRGVLGSVDRHGRALEDDLTLVGGMDPGDALDERGLARAVVADEGHDLAGGNAEVHLVQRLDGPEALRDPPQLENRVAFGHRIRSLPRCTGPRTDRCRRPPSSGSRPRSGRRRSPS